MALTLQSSHLVWQKVAKALANANPAAQKAFKGLKEYLATQGGNPNLEFYFFSEAQADDADGTGIVDAASELFGVYIKKANAATDNWFKLYNNATVDTTDGDAMVALPLLLANEEAFAIYPGGLDFSVGITVTQHTTLIGTTDGSDGGDGFLIVGAA